MLKALDLLNQGFFENSRNMGLAETCLNVIYWDKIVILERITQSSLKESKNVDVPQNSQQVLFVISMNEILNTSHKFVYIKYKLYGPYKKINQNNSMLRIGFRKTTSNQYANF